MTLIRNTEATFIIRNNVSLIFLILFMFCKSQLSRRLNNYNNYYSDMSKNFIERENH